MQTDVNDALIKAIKDGVPIETLKMDGREYFSHNVAIPPAEARPKCLSLHTLGGLIDYLESKIDHESHNDQLVIRIIDETKVDLFGPIALRDHGRNYYVSVDISKLFPASSFKFGTFYEPDQFNIAVQSYFLDAFDRPKVLKLAGSITVEAIQTSEDDGIAQQVAVKKNIAFKETATLPNPVMLAPHRTFREIEQPESPFVFRGRQLEEGKPVQLALFEADGDRWKLEAVKKAAEWLQQRVVDLGLEDEVKIIA